MRSQFFKSYLLMIIKIIFTCRFTDIKFKFFFNGDFHFFSPGDVYFSDNSDGQPSILDFYFVNNNSLKFCKLINCYLLKIKRISLLYANQFLFLSLLLWHSHCVSIKPIQYVQSIIMGVPKLSNPDTAIVD